MDTGTDGDRTTPPLEDLFRRQQTRARALRRSAAAERIERIRRLLAVLKAYEYHICLAARADFGKPEAEVALTELLPVIAEAKHTIAHLRRWMKPQRVRPTLAMVGTSAHIRHEPKGVTLIIAPWNYPINLSLGPLVAAIAAGNTAIIKPSELTPQLAAVTRLIVEEAFEPEEVAVVEGGPEVARALLELPFDHIFFTGSPAVGKLVMAAASRHLSSVTLELGGKSPTIVDASADLGRAARNIVWGKFANAGQTCIAPDYLLVHNSVRIEFVEEAVRCLRRAYGHTAGEQQSTGDFARIVNERHHQRLLELLQDAQGRGAQVVVGGIADAGQRYLAPTLLVNVSLDAQLMQEEIFGPLLPIIGFDDLDEAIALINDKPKPLALYVYARDRAVIERVLTETSAGDSCINHNLIHYLHQNLPFGGVNHSGIGKAHGYASFQAFSHQRSVLRDRLTVFQWLFPPYTPGVRRLIDFARRFLT